MALPVLCYTDSTRCASDNTTWGKKFSRQQNPTDIFRKGHNHFESQQHEGAEQFSLVNLMWPIIFSGGSRKLISNIVKAAKRSLSLSTSNRC